MYFKYIYLEKSQTEINLLSDFIVTSKFYLVSALTLSLTSDQNF